MAQAGISLVFPGHRSQGRDLLEQNFRAYRYRTLFHMGLWLDLLVLDKRLGVDYSGPESCPECWLWPGSNEYPGCLCGDRDGKIRSLNTSLSGSGGDSGRYRPGSSCIQEPLTPAGGEAFFLAEDQAFRYEKGANLK